MDDVIFAFSQVERREAERKAKAIPEQLLGSAWALESQTEAVIDALLAATTHDAPQSAIHARHVGEWAARIAEQMPCAPSPSFMRRCGVLADMDPLILEKLPEVRDCASVVRAFQRARMQRQHGELRSAALIVAIADEFQSLLGQSDERCGASNVMRAMVQCADEESREVIQALLRAARATHLAALPATA